MKKLMCAAAALVAGFAMADGITSANIVGYQTSNVRDNEPGAQVFTMMSIPFAGVTGGDFDTTNLKITGALETDDPGSYGDIIQIWKKDEGGVDEYYCYTDDGLWYNTLTEELLTDDHPTLPAGTAFWYILDNYSDNSAGRETPAMTVSGAVDSTEYYSWTLRANEEGAQVFTMLANPYPSSWMIADGDCEISGALTSDDPGNYGDIIQIWKKESGGVDEYYCYNDDGLWYNTLTEELLTDDYADGIPAGSAFWYILDMYSDASASRAASTTITFNNPLK